MKKVLLGLAIVAWLSGVMPASGHVVEVTTSLDAAEAQDPANFKQALRAAVDKILSVHEKEEPDEDGTARAENLTSEHRR